MAQGVQGVLQAPQHCFLEYQGFQGYPVAPVVPGAQGGRGGLAQNVFSLGREKLNGWHTNKKKKLSSKSSDSQFNFIFIA